MKALHFVKTGTLAWRDVADLRVNGPLEAVVRPLASTACDLDRSIIAGQVDFGRDYPIGHECVAEVIDVGAAVRHFVPSDICVVPWHISCGVCAQCRQGLPTACSTVPGLSGYGAPIAGHWGGLFSDEVKVPFADGMLTRLPDTIEPVRAASASDNLTDAYVAAWRGLSRHPAAAVLVVSSLPSLGLFAVDQALALGAAGVAFVDPDEERRELAAQLGAAAYPAIDPARHHSAFPIVLSATAEPKRLADAIRCLTPGGHLSNIGMFFQDVRMPVWEMYQRDVTFSTGFVSITPHVQHVLSLLERNRLHPQIFATTHEWDSAPDVLLEPHVKPVLTRPPLPR
ncbi:alcohol dehydrogenase catalytic domain-containing protein [Mycobacterium sp.]|uniref:alcohol dehydrogenase catalytic domain-containing protein n=1 Tax=Mycobacterium sp. TaxID=1785 RepID=UPI003D0B3262